MRLLSRSLAVAALALAVSRAPVLASQARGAPPRPSDTAPKPLGRQVDPAARLGAIAGRVVNEGREPVAGVSVSALRRDTTPGRRFIVVAGRHGATDERGRFRVDDVPPGEFFLCASRREAKNPASQAWSFHPRVGYVTTCYPGSPTLEGAGKVTVRSGEETPDVELVLRTARLGRVTVTATDALGRPLVVPQSAVRQNNGGVTLTPRGRDFPGFGESPVTPEPGRFVFTSVPPGDYYAAASLLRIHDSGFVRDGGFTEVTVDGDDVAVSVGMNTGATLAGRVVREGPPPSLPALPPATRSRMRQITIATLPESGRGKPPFNPGTVTVGEDGTFRIAGVRGTIFLTLWSATGTLKAIRRAGQDVTGEPFRLRGDERIDDIDVVLTTETGRVAGVVMDGSGQPASGAWVIAFSEDPRRWHPGSAGVACLPTATESAVSGHGRPVGAGPAEPGRGGGRGVATPGLPSLPAGPGSFGAALLPGRYYVAALEGYDVTTLPGWDSELLQVLLPKAAVVDVAAGQTATVAVRLGPREGQSPIR